MKNVALKNRTQVFSILKKIVKHTPLLFLTTPLLLNAEERDGLLINGSLIVEHTDNVLNNINEISDTALILAPELKYLGLVGKHKFLISYDGKLANYTKDSNFNYSEHELNIEARLDHSHKLDTEFKLGFEKSIETPGSTNSSTQTLTDFNQYQKLSGLARVYYGQKESIGQIVLGYSYKDYEYSNNQQDFRNYKLNQLSATFFYRIAPKTRLLFQATASENKYEDQVLTNGIAFNQTSEQQLYLAGVEWEATAKTTGIFKIGYQDRDYEDTRFNDLSGLSYFLDMIWKPNTYTNIKLSATRQTTESALINEGGFLSSTYGINLSHYFMARTALTAQINLDNDEIVTINSRTDKRNSFKVGIKHSLREWLNIKLEYKYQEKTSNINLFNFESNNVQLSLETAFE